MKVERAIILAAGRGDRLRPITDEIPKPMITVNGQRIIDTILDALYLNGIREIYIITGYLKEKYQVLKEKYPDVVLLENEYTGCNNISSVFIAREHLKNTFIIAGDHIIRNPKVLDTEFTESGYNSIYTPDPTKEWIFDTEDNEHIFHCNRYGSDEGGWQLFGISRWSADDAAKLSRFIEEAFSAEENRSKYWDEIALIDHKDDFTLRIYPMDQSDIFEIDTLEDILNVDESWREKVAKMK
ncbi:MAG: phosphocholine cytidylyltransferase family protein [Lachnospiraceae bacterium]|nr:phosphocholine cytidylyltransferase family protein [Lachnospiraceae bacterium]